MTILVHIMYKVNFDHNQDDPKSCRLIIEYHYYCFDDKKHDNLFVQKCFNLHWGHLTNNGFYPKKHIVWSDGCTLKFKGARTGFMVPKVDPMQ
jgi:hypothetical protein